MQHSYIDRYADLDSFIHRIDPRVKIITFFMLILFVVLTDPTAYLSFFLYSLILFFLVIISKLPFLFVFKKSLVIIPFVLLIAVFMPFIKKGEVIYSYSLGSLTLQFSRDGVVLFLGVLIKSYLAVISMILLVSTTRFITFLKGLQRLRMPGIFIMILSFMYRYSFLVVDEVQRMQRAKASRSFKGMKKRSMMRVLANVAGVLFVRSYERAERVYLAMCSRNFQGEIRTLDTLRIKLVDVMFLISVFIILFLSNLFRFG